MLSNTSHHWPPPLRHSLSFCAYVFWFSFHFLSGSFWGYFMASLFSNSGLNIKSSSSLSLGLLLNITLSLGNVLHANRFIQHYMLLTVNSYLSSLYVTSEFQFYVYKYLTICSLYIYQKHLTLNISKTELTNFSPVQPSFGVFM